MTETIRTRPALRTLGESPSATQYRLRFSVVFHPDVKRIGARVDLHAWSVDEALKRVTEVSLGRLEPLLSDGSPLLDEYVSRNAVTIQVRPNGDGLGGASVIVRACEGSDCRIGREERSEYLADWATIRSGVPLRLGHGVVGLLRLIGPGCDDVDADAPKAFVLGDAMETRLLRAQIVSAGITELPVLLLGESGVGKERIARALHAASLRCHKPLVSVNMAAIPEGLGASELFGATRGAYTGAGSRAGYFQQADGGTLFLDEIGDAPPVLQTQLLRALEQGEIQTVGGKAGTVNVRIIAATDASVAAEDGFRHALLTRLSGLTLSVPPLRHRLEDIGAQVLGMLAECEGEGVVPMALASQRPDVAAHWARFFFDALCHDWPGNSRELRHQVERAFHGDNAVAPLREYTQLSAADDTICDERLEQIHDDSDFEVSATATALGLSRQSVYRRIQAHPRLTLCSELSESEIRAALDGTDRLEDAARQLGVSARALRARIKKLAVGG